MGVTPETSLVGIAARGVNHSESDVRARVLELRKQSIDADTIAPNIIFVPDLRIDRNHIALSARLNTEYVNFAKLWCRFTLRRTDRTYIWAVNGMTYTIKKYD